MIELPIVSVCKEYPFAAFIECIRLNLSQMLFAKLRVHSLYFNKRKHLLVKSDSKVRKLAFNSIFRSKLCVFVITESFAKKVCNNQTSIAFIRVSVAKVGKRLRIFFNHSTHSFACICFPLRHGAFFLKRGFAHNFIVG